MRRWPTWLLVGALAALGAIAAADALRGGETEVAPGPRRTATVPLIPGNEPAASAISGVLYYSDPGDDCRLHGLAFPDLGEAPPPKLRSCYFSLSPDGRSGLPAEAQWSPEGGLYAREDGSLLELGSPGSTRTLRFRGRTPAFKPDGTFTYVRGEDVVEWTTDCPRGARRFTLPGDNATARCSEVVLSPADLRRSTISADGGPLVLKDVAWLGDTRLVAVLGDAGVSGYREHVAVFEARAAVGLTFSEFGEGLRIEASPRGGFFTAWYSHTLVAVRNRDGDLIPFPPLSRVHALTWSPDERWTAVATPHSVFVFRTDEGEARIRRLPIVASDLAWR